MAARATLFPHEESPKGRLLRPLLRTLPNGCRIPRRAAEHHELLEKASVAEWGPDLPGFDGFWSFLARLAACESRASCRDRSCDPEPCAIRTCASAKGLDACPFCASYPCQRIEALAGRYVTLLGDGLRMREVGIDRWIQEQDARRDCGFAYADLQIPRRDAGPRKRER